MYLSKSFIDSLEAHFSTFQVRELKEAQMSFW